MGISGILYITALSEYHNNITVFDIIKCAIPHRNTFGLFSYYGNKGVSCGGCQTHIQGSREKSSRVKTCSLDGAKLAKLGRGPVEKDIYCEICKMSQTYCL